MEKKEIEVGHPVAVAGITLIPVTMTSLNYQHGKGRFSVFGGKRPVGIIVVSPPVKRAFRVTGEEVPLDQFMQEVPEIKEILAGM